jgi:hypothetical protein
MYIVESRRSGFDWVTDYEGQYEAQANAAADGRKAALKWFLFRGPDRSHDVVLTRIPDDPHDVYLYRQVWVIRRRACSGTYDPYIVYGPTTYKELDVEVRSTVRGYTTTYYATSRKPLALEAWSVEVFAKHAPSMEDGARCGQGVVDGVHWMRIIIHRDIKAEQNIPF